RHTRSKRDWSSDVCSSDLALALAACSDSGSSDPANTDSSAASESADGNGSDAESNNPADESQFPITVEHALGETVIESKPERVEIGRASCREREWISQGAL